MNEEESFEELLESITEENVVIEESLPVENVIKKQSIILENDADAASLVFFSNPLYLGRINQKMVNKTKEHTKSEIKFYRKRLTTLFKEMLKESEGEGEEKTKELKEAHDSFITKAINYFQVMDTKDIIQGQYLKDDVETNKGMCDALPAGFPLEGVVGLAERAGPPLRGNEFMMRKTINVASLDNYVISNQDLSSNDMRIIPMKINIDLKTPDLKVKGVKSKLKKTVNKQEAQETIETIEAQESINNLNK